MVIGRGIDNIVSMLAKVVNKRVAAAGTFITGKLPAGTNKLPVAANTSPKTGTSAADTPAFLALAGNSWNVCPPERASAGRIPGGAATGPLHPPSDSPKTHSASAGLSAPSRRYPATGPRSTSRSDRQRLRTSERKWWGVGRRFLVCFR